jgi:hypothetical protein
MKEIDEDAIQGTEAWRKTPPARILRRLGLAEAKAARKPVKALAQLVLSERKLWFKFEATRELRKLGSA